MGESCITKRKGRMYQLLRSKRTEKKRKGRRKMMGDEPKLGLEDE